MPVAEIIEKKLEQRPAAEDLINANILKGLTHKHLSELIDTNKPLLLHQLCRQHKRISNAQN